MWTDYTFFFLLGVFINDISGFVPYIKGHIFLTRAWFTRSKLQLNGIETTLRSRGMCPLRSRGNGVGTAWVCDANTYFRQLASTSQPAPTTECGIARSLNTGRREGFAAAVCNRLLLFEGWVGQEKPERQTRDGRWGGERPWSCRPEMSWARYMLDELAVVEGKHGLSDIYTVRDVDRCIAYSSQICVGKCYRRIVKAADGSVARYRGTDVKKIWFVM